MIEKMRTWALTAMIVSIAISALLGLLILIRAISKILWSQEAAGWMQAIFSVVAIYGAFLLSSQQHKRDLLAEQVRQQHEASEANDDELAVRTLAVRNLVQVAYSGLESADKLIDLAVGSEPAWEKDKYVTHMGHTRAVLDSLITPDTEHLALITALNVARTLNQVGNDMQHLGGTKREEVLLRSRDAVASAYALVGRLTNIQSKMLDLCRQRGIPVEIDDFRRT